MGFLGLCLLFVGIALIMNGVAIAFNYLAKLDLRAFGWWLGGDEND
jgi:hypothetical protein